MFTYGTFIKPTSLRRLIRFAVTGYVCAYVYTHEEPVIHSGWYVIVKRLCSDFFSHRSLLVLVSTYMTMISFIDTDTFTGGIPTTLY